MKILHFYPGNDKMIAQYISALCANMNEHASILSSNTYGSFRKKLYKEHPNIVHLHGCWHLSLALAALAAHKNGARTVLTPHGQLEPWIIKQHFWSEKLPKQILFQKRMANKAYAIIAMGKMEEACLKRFCKNKRIEKVHNALITDSISTTEMATKIAAIYNKVDNSNPLEKMGENAKHAIAILIKAGTTGNKYMVSDNEYNCCAELSDSEKSRVLLYAHLENIEETISKGIAVLWLTGFSADISLHEYYLPAHYIVPHTSTVEQKEGASVEEATTSAIESFSRLVKKKQPLISHVVKLAQLLYTIDADEKSITQALEELGLGKFTGRLMQVLADTTALGEGFMLSEPINDRHTRKIRTLINKNLKI